MGRAQTAKALIFNGIARWERVLSPSRNLPLSTIRNFLLPQYQSALGAVVHATPIVPALRDAVPGCRIAVIASGIALQGYRNNPGVDTLIETPSPFRDLRGAVRALRAHHPFRGEIFATLTTVGNERTAIALQTLLAGAGNRVGFTVAPQLYRVALHHDSRYSVIGSNLKIVESLGHPTRHFEPQIFFSDADLTWASQSLAASGVSAGQMVVAFVTQTSVTQRKSWRAERFQATANWLIERFGAHIVFVGTAAEAPAIDAIRASIAHPQSTSSTAGQTSLSQLAALLSLCRVGVTLDTGTLHIGRAVGLPMVIIAPAWSPPIEWLPLDNPRYRILKNADIEGAPPDYIIDEVTVEEVLAELDSLIGAFGEPPARAEP